eukprot:TRINITY_DN36084_c0_g1_i1.p1 TRINITY_DN36084_c0_g1~~TRINITY_DN36084_c0_g1_i1.p1  ORF type:complete len:919 (-),score=116.73 TRINITY_DN36084_c0_g1_i1:67-2676(-)
MAATPSEVLEATTQNSLLPNASRPRINCRRSCRGLFLSLMGAVYFMAFASYYIQYPGLLGADGLLPAASFWDQIHAARLDNVRSDQPAELSLRTALSWWSNGVGAFVGITALDKHIPRIVLAPPSGLANTLQAFFSFPTWLWFLTGEDGLHPDQALEGLALSGAVLALLATIGVHHVVVFALLYMNYLSLFLLGQDWTGFQWDIFLLETGALILPYCSITTLTARGAKPAAAWLLRLLVVKFMFMNGIVKLQAECPTWKHLTALEYHFASTCIPTSEAWAVHQLPPFILRLATAFMFLFELAGPLLFLVPVKSVRRVGVVAQVALQAGIMATGNYNWFNVHTIALTLPAWDADDYGDGNGENAPLPLRMALLPARAWNWFWSGWSGCFVGTSLGTGFLGWCFCQMFAIHVTDSSTPLALEDVAAWATTLITKPQAAIEDSASRIYSDNFRVEPLFGQAQVSTFITTLLSSQSMKVVFAVLAVACVRHAVAPMCSSPRRGFLRRAVAVGVSVGRLANMGLLLPAAVICLLPLEELGVRDFVPFRAAARPLETALAPWQVSSGYGLFRMMTGVGNAPKDAMRWGGLPPSVVDVPVVVVEGTDDGQTWREIPFRYTPGNVTKQPRRTAPHQPRLDWQMWFAALDSYENNPWFIHLIYKLLEGDGAAVELLDVDMYPWKDRDPPKAIRAKLFHYDFTRLDTPWARNIPGTQLLTSFESDVDGKVLEQWWTRRSQGSYLPPVSSKSLRQAVQGQGWPVGRAARAEAVAIARDCKPAHRGGPVLGFWCETVIAARQHFVAVVPRCSGWSFHSSLLRKLWSGASELFFLDVNLVLIVGSLLVSIVVSRLADRISCCCFAVAVRIFSRKSKGKLKKE